MSTAPNDILYLDNGILGRVLSEAKTNQFWFFLFLLVLLVLMCIAYWFVMLSILWNRKQFGCPYFGQYVQSSAFLFLFFYPGRKLIGSFLVK